MAEILDRFETAFAALIDAASRSALRRAAVLVTLCVLVFAPGIAALPVTDRDEGRFVQASKQMMETGDLIDIRFQDDPRWKKPAGIYWLQSASISQFGGPEAPIWAYRLVSFLGAMLAVLGTSWALRPLIGARRAMVAAAFLAVTPLMATEAHIAKTDATLLALVVFAQGALARIWLAGGRGKNSDAAIFWVAMAAGILIKGPIVPMVSIATIAWICAWQGRARWLARLKPLWGVPLLLVLVAPWLVAIWIVSDGAFFTEAIGKDLVGKVQSGQESHGAPPGYYFGTFWGTFWPWAPLALFAVPFAWARRKESGTMFLLGWIVPVWIVLELVPTKLPHYVLPLYPAMAGIVAAAALGECRDIIQRGEKRRWIATGLFALPVVALGLAGLFGPLIIEGRIVLGGAVLGLIGLAFGAVAIRAYAWGRIEAAIAPAMLSGMAVIVAAFQFVIPSLETAFPSPRLAAAAAPYTACTDQPLGSADYSEPSLVFLAGTETELLRWEDAADWMAEGDGRFLWMSDRRREKFDKRAAKRGFEVVELAEVSGFNYNRGKSMTWRLLVRADDPVRTSCDALDPKTGW